MAHAKTFSMTIAEMREFASFSAEEQRFIEHSLAVATGRVEAGTACEQALAYRDLPELKKAVPCDSSLEGVAEFVGQLIRISARDLGEEQIESFSAYRFLYERLLGGSVRPYLPSAFVGASALPQIRPWRRRILLQSLSESAATAPGWSDREPCFHPEAIDAEAA